MWHNYYGVNAYNYVILQVSDIISYKAYMYTSLVPRPYTQFFNVSACNIEKTGYIYRAWG